MIMSRWILLTIFLFIANTNAMDKRGNKSSIRLSSYDPSIVKQIQEIVHTYSVTIFSKSYCQYSKQTKDILFQYNLKNVGVFELDQQRLEATVYQDALEYLTGARTVPRVFIGGKFVGGADQIVGLYQNGRLSQLLRDAGAILY